jgi:hypothetical protein
MLEINVVEHGSTVSQLHSRVFVRHEREWDAGCGACLRRLQFHCAPEEGNNLQSGRAIFWRNAGFEGD